mmetsp:Transcript_15435/g.24139  ORF Transcript_15435/g.24139 Transcript_15435/m.24139 type:complete len:113 (-) Transcript_15435:11-349(-)
MSTEIQKSESNKCLVWGACSSTTTSITTLSNEMFCGKSGNRTKFVVENCTIGAQVEKVSAIGLEKEVLLPPLTRLQVMGYVDLGNGLTEFQLAYCPPSRPLIELTPPDKFLS